MNILFLDEASRGNSWEHIVLTSCLFLEKRLCGNLKSGSFLLNIVLLSGMVVRNLSALNAFPLYSGIFLLELAIGPDLELAGLIY